LCTSFSVFISSWRAFREMVLSLTSKSRKLMFCFKAFTSAVQDWLASSFEESCSWSRDVFLASPSASASPPSSSMVLWERFISLRLSVTARALPIAQAASLPIKLLFRNSLSSFTQWTIISPKTSKPS
jgi:hypothetical protein